MHMRRYPVCTCHDDHNNERDQDIMECTGKDLSIQDIICLSEELKTNTITTGLSLDCQEQKARNQMKMK